MKKTILALLCILTVTPLFSEENQKVYRVNIKNFKQEERNFKEMTIGGDRLYFFSRETNMLYCFGATDKNEVWRLTLETLPNHRQYTGLFADKLGRCILSAPQQKGVNVIEMSNVGRIAEEHKFPELSLKKGKFTLFNGAILFDGKEVGKLKTQLVFLKEERNPVSDYGLIVSKPVMLSNSSYKINATVAGKEKTEFSFELKYSEPTSIAKVNAIRLDNYGRAYFHIVTVKDYRAKGELPEDVEFKNTVMLTDLTGKILFSMDPINALSSMITADDEGKILEIYTVKDPDKKKGSIRKAYYWYVKYNPK
ncbi:MAG: hypothetical protein WCI43_00415 [Candidatus Firestonebacteria bacterium]